MENVQTGDTLGSAHKCNVCNKPFTRECYKKGYYTFRQELQTVSRQANNEANIKELVKSAYGERVVDCELNDDGSLKLWIRACDGKWYCVASGGCSKHPYIDGFNAGIKVLAKGEVALGLCLKMSGSSVAKSLRTLSRRRLTIVAAQLDRMEAEIIANGTTTENPYEMFEKERKEKKSRSELRRRTPMLRRFKMPRPLES